MGMCRIEVARSPKPSRWYVVRLDSLYKPVDTLGPYPSRKAAEADAKGRRLTIIT